MRKISQILENSSHIDNKNKQRIIELLKSAFCEEMNAWYQYVIAAPFLVGNERTEIAEFYKEAAEDELTDHGYWILERINQLGGDPSDILSPNNWNQLATHKYIIPNNKFDVVESIQQNIEAEEGAIETYVELEGATRNIDTTTNTKVKEILADEEEHLQELQEFLADLTK